MTTCSRHVPSMQQPLQLQRHRRLLVARMQLPHRLVQLVLLRLPASLPLLPLSLRGARSSPPPRGSRQGSCAQRLGTATPAVPAPKGDKGGVSGLWSRLTPQTGEPYALKRCPVWTHFYKPQPSFRPFTPVQP